MEEPGAGVRGGEEGHVADAQRLGPAEVALSTATAPGPVHGLVGDGTVEVCHAPEARLSTEIDDKGSDFALGLVTPVECASSSFQGRRFQRGEEEGSSSEQRVMDMAEGKEGSLAPAASAENAGLQICHEANGRLSNKTLPSPCREAVCSEDARCAYDILEKTTEGSQFEQVGLTGNGGDCDVMVGVVKETVEDLRTVCNRAKHVYEGLSVSVNDGSEQEPCGVDGIGSIDELQPDGLISDIEAVSMPAHEDSVPSISGSIDLSLDRKAGQFGGISADPGMCHRSDRGMWNGDLAHDNGDLSDPGKHHSEKLPSGAEGLTLITGANYELEKVGFLPNIDAVNFCPVVETSVPSIYGSSIDVPLDGQAVELQMEAYGDGNQHFGPCPDKELQQVSLKYGASELPPERNQLVYSYNQLCNDEPCCSSKEPSALCLGHQDAVGRSDHLDQGLNACNSADDSSVDFIGNANDGESQSQKLTALQVFIRRNPKRAASSRSLNSEKQDRIGKGSSGSRKPKKVDIMSSLHQSTVDMFPNKITKGRSGMNRPPKSSTWGNLEQLLDCCPRYGPSTSNAHPICLDKGISYNRSDQRSQPSIRRSRSSRSSKSKCSSFSEIGHAANELDGQPTLTTVADIGHAASELNEQPTFSIVADTDISLECHRGNIPNLSSDKLINILDSTGKTTESIDSHRTESKCIQTDVQQRERALVSCTKETCTAYVHGECAKLSTSEPMDNANGSVMLHIGFSPDSVLEVASVTCEGNASASHDVMLHENPTDAGALNGGDPSILSTSDCGKEHASSLMNLEQHARSTLHEDTRKEEVGPSHGTVENDIGEGKVQALQKSNSVRKNGIVRKAGCKKKDGSKGVKKNVIGYSKVSPCESSKLRPFSSGPISPGPPDDGSCFEALTSGSQDLSMHEHDGIQSHSVVHGDKGSAFDSMKSPRRKIKDTNARKKGKVRDPHKKEKGKKKNTSGETSLDHGLLHLPSTEQAAPHMNEQSNLDPTSELAFKNSGAISTDLPGNVACKMDGASVAPLPPRAAWVCCDDCQKWRCIPAELADVIGETNCRWTCKDNGDKAFADCSIPQVKTNAEINAELDLSDASADEADNGESNSKACKPPSWTLVRSNLFLHRNRRTQSIDESMVCNCKPPQDGRMGCRDGCLNRMLNIECAKRTCPCGEQCSNQKFQRRSYAKLRWFHSGKKGYGLQLQEDVTEGRFLTEYVGEVLDITSYESRQRYYASKGQKHFYFMALNGGEVIDACTKGNLGRFINHSCSPNCRTEKWMVNGEVCIGIFALRNIKKGEELTFDYNYVRVSGAAPQKCFCGTAKCRGYLGGDVSIVDTIITQDDTEADHFEQMVVDKDSEELLGPNGSDSDGSHPNISETEFSIQGEDLHDSSAAKVELDLLEETRGTPFETSEPEHSLEAWSPPEDEDVNRTPVHVSRTFESSLQTFPVHDTQSSDLLRKTANSTEGSKAPNIINGSTLSSDFRGNLVPTFSATERKNLKQHKNQKPQPSSPIDNEHILGVEGRLNSLLDVDGGISKRKDATNGYLKLLLVTAAEGGSAGGTSKSMRDLSLILEALLKTKSHSVLLDIINKNGLQMLHNILKQNRHIFHRTPITRKLLKVLEFLAQKGILTSEHINGGPRCAGVESFRDSMLSLTRHHDVQVHQIARSFRDRWIPRSTSTFVYDVQGTNTVWSSDRRKRKSRWDYQPDEHYKMVGLKIQKVFCGFMRNKLQRNQGANNYCTDVLGMGSSTQGADDEVPPGFESQLECRPAQLSIGSEVAPGLCMERYQPSLSISYGVPVTLVQHFGTPESEGGQCHQKWKVAPGVPFSPFPPLPPYPRGSPCPSTSSSQMFQHDGTPQVKHNNSGQCGRIMGRDGRVHRSWRNGPRSKWPYHQGRKFSSTHHRFERFEPPKPQ